MRFRASAISAAILVILLLLVAGLAFQRGRPALRETAPEPPAPAGAPEPAPAPAPPPSPSRSILEPVAHMASSPASRPEPGETARQLTELRGRLLLPSGGPAVATQLQLSGWQANQERVIRYGLPKNWKDIEATTDSEGRFALRFDPPLAYQFTLDAKLPGHADVGWRWGELPVGQVVDVGEVVLSRGGSIVGRVVNREGKPAGGNWHIYAETTYRPPDAGGDATTVRGPADPVTGEFRLEDVPPGHASLKAYSRIANWIRGPRVMVEAGAEARADIVYDGPDNSRRIVAIPFSRPFYIFHPEPGSIVLHGSSRDPLVAAQIPGSSQSWSFDDLDPGSYTIEIRDPKFQPWVRAGVSPGESVDAHLKGNGAVALTVLDGSGAPVHDYRLKIRFRFEGKPWSSSPDTFELRAGDRPEPPGGVYEGLIPWDFTLAVEAPGYTVAEADVDDLKPGETRAVTVRLGGGATVVGFVFRSDGTTPVEGASVSLALPVPEADLPEWLEALQDDADRSGRILKTVSDASGRFEFSAVPPRRYRLVVALSRLLRVRQGLEVERSGPAAPLKVLLPAFGDLRGRLIGPVGARFDGIKVSARPDEGKPPSPLDRARVPPPVEVAADGAFRVGPLPAGPVVVSASMEEFLVPVGSGVQIGSGAASVDLGRAQIRDGEETEAEFDLGDRCPGTLIVAATVDGKPAPGLVVEASGGPGPAGGRVGADGTARLTVFAGNWTPTVRPVEGGWVASSPPVRVPAAGEAETRIDVVLAEGTLLVLDADSGNPLANRSVSVGSPRPGFESTPEHARFPTAGWIQGGTTTGRTDAEGRLSLRLPAGVYQVADAGDGTALLAPAPAVADLSWPPLGASAEVRIPRAKALQIPGR